MCASSRKVLVTGVCTPVVVVVGISSVSIMVFGLWIGLDVWGELSFDLSNSLLDVMIYDCLRSQEESGAGLSFELERKIKSFITNFFLSFVRVSITS